MKAHGRVAGHGCRDLVLQAVARLPVGTRLTLQQDGEKIPESLHGPRLGQASRYLPHQESVLTERLKAEPQVLERGEKRRDLATMSGVDLHGERKKKGLTRAFVCREVGENLFVEDAFVGRVLIEKIESIGIMGHDETVTILGDHHRGRRLPVCGGLGGAGDRGGGLPGMAQIAMKHGGGS